MRAAEARVDHHAVTRPQPVLAGLLRVEAQAGQVGPLHRRTPPAGRDRGVDRLPGGGQRGVPGIELPQVMLEMQKASVSFRAITEVRNRFVNAYQEIMNMPI